MIGGKDCFHRTLLRIAAAEYGPSQALFEPVQGQTVDASRERNVPHLAGQLLPFRPQIIADKLADVGSAGHILPHVNEQGSGQGRIGAIIDGLIGGGDATVTTVYSYGFQASPVLGKVGIAEVAQAAVVPRDSLNQHVSSSLEVKSPREAWASPLTVSVK